MRRITPTANTPYAGWPCRNMRRYTSFLLGLSGRVAILIDVRLSHNVRAKAAAERHVVYLRLYDTSRPI